MQTYINVIYTIRRGIVQARAIAGSRWYNGRYFRHVIFSTLNFRRPVFCEYFSYLNFQLIIFKCPKT